MPTAIVTDSTADLPAAWLQRYGIHVVPNILVLDGESYEDGTGISRQEFYTRLPGFKTTPTTGSASAGKFQMLYEQLFSQGFSEIVSVHVASQLSGVFNSASLAAQSFAGSVHIVDSGQLSLGLGFMALAGAQAARAGLPAQAVIQRIQIVSQRLHVVAMLDTLEYVRRSGRVSWARARLGALLDIKPFLSIRDGKVSSQGEVRTRRKGLERLKNMIQALGSLERLAILHTNAEADAQQLLQSLGALSLPPEAAEVQIVNVTTVIGTHVGPNGLGFAALTQEDQAKSQ